MSNSLASSLISQAWDILRVDGSSIDLPALQSAGMLNVLNRSNKEFIEFPYECNQTAWSFMRAETGITFIADTTITSAIAVGATTIPMASTTSFPTAGAGVLYSNGLYDIIEWTGISSLTLTGVTGVDFAHTSGGAFSLFYAVPTNFARTRAGRNNGDGIRVNGANFYLTGDYPRAWEFSIYDNGTSKYVWFPRGMSGSASVSYDKQATDITSSALAVDVPPTYEDFIIYRLVEHGNRVLNRDETQLQDARMNADRALRRGLQSRVFGKRPVLVRGPMPEPIMLDGKYIFIP